MIAFRKNQNYEQVIFSSPVILVSDCGLNLELS